MKGDAPCTTDVLNLANRYDSLVFKPAHVQYFGHSHFMNYGYWDETVTNQKEACELLMEKLLAFVPEKRGTILDVACGKGATTRYLMQHYSPVDITGINISEKQIVAARGNAPGCNFLIMDATQLQLADNSFDTIICVEAAFHFFTRQKFFQEALRILKPGGYLVLSDLLMTLEAEKRRAHRYEENYIQDPEAYARFFGDSGFHDIRVVDATEPCWHRHFWNVIHYFHNDFLHHNIDQSNLSSLLDLLYQRVPDTNYYVLAAGRKGE